MGEVGLLAAVAQWLSAIGIPAMFIAWYRLREDINALKVELATMKAKVNEADSLRHDVNEMKVTMTEVRIIVGELKVRLDYQNRAQDEAHRRRSTDG